MDNEYMNNGNGNSFADPNNQQNPNAGGQYGAPQGGQPYGAPQGGQQFGGPQPFGGFEPPKKSNKGLAIGIGVVVGVVALAGIGFGAYTLLKPKATGKVAVEKAFTNALKSDKLMNTLAADPELLQKTGATVGGKLGYQGYSFDFEVANDPAKKVFSEDLTLNVGTSLNVKAVLDDDEIKVQLPAVMGSDYVLYNYKADDNNGFITEVYDEMGITEEQATKFLASVFQGADYDKMQKQVEEANKKIWDSIELEPVEAKECEINGKTKQCDGYLINIDKDLINLVIDNYAPLYKDSYDMAASMSTSGAEVPSFDELVSQLKSEIGDIPEMKLTMYVDNEYLAALVFKCGAIKGEYSDTDPFTLELDFLGGSTPTENMRLLYNDQKVAEIEGSSKDGVENRKLYIQDMKLIETDYDTKSGDLTLKSNSLIGVDAKAKFLEKDGGFDFELESLSVKGESIDVDCKLYLKQGAEIAEIDESGKAIDIGKMSKSEIADAVEGNWNLDAFNDISTALRSM